MNTKYLVVHTYLDLEKTKEVNRPVWRSTVKEHDEWVQAHDDMRAKFSACIDNKTISAGFNHESAYIEDIDGRHSVFTITKKEI